MLMAGLLAVAPAALASGGSGGGGHGGGGGGGTTTTTTTPGSCGTITGFTNRTGYVRNFPAIWTSFSIASSCSTPPNWEVTSSPNNSFVEFGFGLSTSVESSGTVEADLRLFSTPYTVTLTLTAPDTHAVLASESAVVTTPPPKS
jgi:hypothetical protein